MYLLDYQNVTLMFFIWEIDFTHTKLTWRLSDSL